MSDSRRALVVGATGYIGRAVVRELVSRDWQVVALVRQLSADPIVQQALAGAELRVCDLADTASLQQRGLRSDHFDAVFSCIASRSGSPEDAWRVEHDMNATLLDAVGARCNHFVLLSAICVQKPMLEFQRAKLAFESRLQQSGLRYTIVRPTAFFKSLAGQIERLRKGKPYLIFGDGELTACKPIAETDLACFLCDCIDDSSRHQKVLPIGGPGPAITPRQQGALLFELMGQPERFKSVPLKLFDSIIFTLSSLSRLLPPLRAKAEFARIGRYYASESMLLWDAEQESYSAEATPEFGEKTLRDFYQHALEKGLAGQELGDQAMFDRT